MDNVGKKLVLSPDLAPNLSSGKNVLGKIGSALIAPFRAALHLLVGKTTSISEQSIALLRLNAEALPPGLHKTIFTSLLRAIDELQDEKMRRKIVEQQVPAGTEVLRSGQTNNDLCILAKGACDIELQQLQETLIRSAPDVFGEISTMLQGPTTAAVKSRGESLVVRIPKPVFDALCKAHPELQEAIWDLIEERQRHTRSIASLKQKGLNPAQILSELAMLRLQTPEETEKASLLDAVKQIVTESGGLFQIEEVSAGTPFIREDKILEKVRIVLSGSANMLINGGRVGKMMPGDFIGDGDVFTPARKSSFEFSAITRMQILTIEPQAFLTLRNQIEDIVSRQREGFLRKERQTIDIDSVRADEVTDEALASSHKKALEAKHFVPLRPSGNDLIFECGRAEQVLCWLGVRGLLAYRGTTGWKMTKELPDGNFELQRAADAPVIGHRQKLINENLRPAIGWMLSESQKAIKMYTKAGLTWEQSRFLLERGIVLKSDPKLKNLSNDEDRRNREHLGNFNRSFAAIQLALSYITDWSKKPDFPKEREMLGEMLQLLLIDTTHQIGITTLMKDPQTREIVLGTLDEMLKMSAVTQEQFQEFIAKESGPLRKQHALDTTRWNGIGVARRTTGLKARLLTDPALGDLYSVSSTNITPVQSQKLDRYIQQLDREVCPALVQELEQILEADGDTLPLITGRTKSATGILEKIGRVQYGNRGKESRKDYCLADLPDAVGARVIVRDVAALEQAMAKMEGALQGRIFEKDDFYGNPKKQDHPYRLVTYTIDIQGVPAEIQLQTLPAAIAAAIDHDIIYKPYAPASLGERELVSSLLRRVAAAETQKRLHNGHPQPGTDSVATRERQPMKHIFQCASPTGGSSISTYVSEESPTWEQDLAEARRYFQWQQANGAKVTIHHGSSALDSSACIGVPAWREVHAETMKRIKKLPGVPAETIDALAQEGVPLFILEAFAEDLDAKGNIERFTREVREKFPKEATRVLQALSIIRIAHQGQNYAIEKTDPEGKPVYPSSLALRHVPYTNHCVQAARTGIQCDFSAEQVIGLLFHDMFEDTNMKPDNLKMVFPEGVELALAITKGKEETRDQYIERMKNETGIPLAAKAIDRDHNLLRAFNLRDSEKYLRRIVAESKDVFAREFNPDAALSKLALRFQMKLEAVEELLERKFGPTAKNA